MDKLSAKTIASKLPFIVGLLSALGPVMLILILVVFQGDPDFAAIMVVILLVLAEASLVVMFFKRQSRLAFLSLALTNAMGLASLFLLSDASCSFDDIYDPDELFPYIAIIPPLAGLIVAAIANARDNGTPWERFLAITASALWVGFFALPIIVAFMDF